MTWRHDGVLGTVTAVSATSISVRASDGYRETFVVASRYPLWLGTLGKVVGG